MKIIAFTLIYSLTFALTGFSQQPNRKADSLLLLLNKAAAADSNKVKLLLEYTRCFYPAKLDTTLVLNRQALEMSEKIGFGYGIARSLNGIAMYYWNTNNPELTIENLQKALNRSVTDRNKDLEALIANNLGVYYGNLGISDSAFKYNAMAVEASKDMADGTRHAKAISDLGMVYYRKGNYVEAIQCILEAKKFYDATQKTAELVATINRIGIIYQNINDVDHALQAYREGLRINETLGDFKLEMAIFQNIGFLYYENKNQPDSGTYYLTKVMEMARESNDQVSFLTAQINLGNIAYKTMDFKRAVELYEEVLKSPLIPNMDYERAAVLVNLGTVYLSMGDLHKAEEYAMKGYQLARDRHILLFEKNAVQTLGELEAERKNYKKAFTYYSRYAELLDTLNNEMVKQKIAETVFQYALQKKDQENEILQKDNEIKHQTIRNQWFYIGAIALILLLVMILLIVITRNNRRQVAMNQVLDLKNKELEELNVTKDKFISIIAHDLKSPFNALLGLLTDLDENFGDYDEEARHSIIHRLKKSSYNTFNLLVNLLDWTQSQRGQIKSAPEEIDVRQVTQEVFTVLSTRAAAKHHDLVDETLPGTLFHSDPQILKAILINLVNNAIKFTPAQGSITVKVMDEGTRMRFEVTDSGIGIPEREQANLFRIDTQYKRSGTENEPGTGLGLVMCREFATILGGEIGVTSEEGKGSTFYFTIPRKNS